MQLEITEQQIKDLDNGSKTVRQLFPQVFKTELEEGVWYKYKIIDCLVLRNSVFNNFGFYRGKFRDNLICSDANLWTKANLEEVKQIMTEELVKRGFMKGCSFTTPRGWDKGINTSGILDFEYFNEYMGWIIYIDGLGVFNNGKFATLIQEPTQKETLQAKIKEIQEEIDKL